MQITPLYSSFFFILQHSLSLFLTARGWHCCTAKLLHHDEEFRPAAAVRGVDDSRILPAGLHRWVAVLHCRCVLTSPYTHTHTVILPNGKILLTVTRVDVNPYKAGCVSRGGWTVGNVFRASHHEKVIWSLWNGIVFSSHKVHISLHLRNFMERHNKSHTQTCQTKRSEKILNLLHN